MSSVRDSLFQIGWLAADVLQRFVAIQGSIRSWRVVLFVPISLSQHQKDAQAIGDCVDDLVARLEVVIPLVAPGSKEDELAQALGHYLCAVKDSVSTYQHLTRLMDYHGKKQRLRGAIRVWLTRREFDRRVQEYIDQGAVLCTVWEEAKDG